MFQTSQARLSGKAKSSMLTSKDVEREVGVFPAQLLASATEQGWVKAEDGSEIPLANIQPASLDLRLGPRAYRLRCSFLPNHEPVSEKLKRYQMGEVDLTGNGEILERGRPYLVPLLETLDLPPAVRAKANPKSSTGRLDIFTRVITDNGIMFDEIPAGYKGRLYLEVVPRTFTVRAAQGETLNQLRLVAGEEAPLDDSEIEALHRKEPLLYDNSTHQPVGRIETNRGLFVPLYLGSARGGTHVGYQARENSDLIDLARRDYYEPHPFWEKVQTERGGRVVLQPEKFYLLLSQDRVRIPPDYASEMTAYDPTSGELRTHYAGFFDPGFGASPGGLLRGSQAALEVRAHDVPFAVEHGQNICKLSFERMIERPNRLYGDALGSNYQGQVVALGKHFKRERDRNGDQEQLFTS